ncbi:MAG: hypothetical protein HQM12_22195 [SAR324 cluster bacterium]|nr:hypothetical protein [SAR324 cluster bacterium]
MTKPTKKPSRNHPENYQKFRKESGMQTNLQTMGKVLSALIFRLGKQWEI